MPRKKIQNSPGSILKRGNKLVIKLFNKQHFTGLNDTKENRIKVEKLKDMMYEDHLKCKFNIPDSKKDLTIYDAFEEFLMLLESRGRTSNTIRGYKLALFSIVPNDMKLNDQIIKKITNEYAISKTQYSTSSKSIYLKKFQIILNFCHNRGYIDEIKLNNLYPMVNKSKGVIPYSEEELECIVNEALAPSDKLIKPDPEFAYLIQFIRYSGSRIKEALEIQISDIDLENNYINFRNKTKKSDVDYLPITNSLRKVILQIFDLKKSSTSVKVDEKLFRWAPSSTSRLTKRFNRIAKNLGCKIYDQAFHRIRNYYSNKILESKDLSLIQMRDLMRHKDIKTTLTHYKNTNINKLKDALEKINL